MSGKYNEKSKSISCTVCNECGGCCYTDIPYEETLRIKQDKVNSLFKNIYVTSGITGMYHPVNYRNKVHGVISSGMNKKVISGCYKEGTHKVVPVDYCMIQDKDADNILNTLTDLFTSFKYVPYNEDSGQGFVRHVLIRKGFSTHEIMVVIVTADVAFPSKKDFIKQLTKLHPEITTIVQNINKSRTNMVLGKKNIILTGKGYIEDVLCKNRFRISPDSFYQINPSQTEKLYKAAIKMSGVKKDDVVLDAYCGIGTIGITMAKYCREVIGVELNPAAVNDAVYNAKLNNISNIHFICQDAGEYMSDNYNILKANVVVMDPPRAGLDINFLNSVIRLSPERIIYISCNPETQARDVLKLMEGGYRITGMETFDLFPYTDNVENIVCMSK